VIEAILAAHRRVIEANGGRASSRGRVFGYPNLFVVDGAIVPAAISQNPSHTIAALVEHVAAHVV